MHVRTPPPVVLGDRERAPVRVPPEPDTAWVDDRLHRSHLGYWAALR